MLGKHYFVISFYTLPPFLMPPLLSTRQVTRSMVYDQDQNSRGLNNLQRGHVFLQAIDTGQCHHHSNRPPNPRPSRPHSQPRDRPPQLLHPVDHQAHGGPPKDRQGSPTAGPCPLLQVVHQEDKEENGLGNQAGNCQYHRTQCQRPQSRDRPSCGDVLCEHHGRR